MGAFIPAIGAGFFKKLLIQFIVSAVTQKIFGKKGARRSSQGPGGSSGILINQSGNNNSIPVSYGRQRLGGTRAFINTSDGSGGYTGSAQNRYLNQVIIISEGLMGAIQRVYFQDKIIWDRSDGGTTDTTGVGSGGARLQNFTTEGQEYNIAHMAYYAGSNTQTVDTTLQTSIGNSIWDNDRKLLGLAYLAMKLPWDKDYNGSGPEITVEIAGKQIRNATDFSGASTASGADQNPADVILDYLTNSTFGKGLSDSDLDATSFSDARNYWHNGGSPKFSINGYIDTSQKLFDNVEEILQACNGILVYTNGKYKLKPRKQNETSVKSFTEDNIIGQFTIQGTPKSSKFNKVELTFNNAGVDFNDDLVIVSNASYKTEDNGTELLGKTETTLVSDPTIAGNIAEWIMENSRNQTTVEFTASHDAINTTANETITAGDIIDITHPVIGYTNKLFRVQQVTLTEDDTLHFIASEYISSIQI